MNNERNYIYVLCYATHCICVYACVSLCMLLVLVQAENYFLAQKDILKRTFNEWE